MEGDAWQGVLREYSSELVSDKDSGITLVATTALAQTTLLHISELE